MRMVWLPLLLLLSLSSYARALKLNNYFGKKGV
jgi:hypothetical protein